MDYDAQPSIMEEYFATVLLTTHTKCADLQILKKGEEISRYLTYKRHAERRESISSLSFFLCPYYFSSQLVITKNKDQDRPRSDLAPSAQ
jgi:hypothetical protein